MRLVRREGRRDLQCEVTGEGAFPAKVLDSPVEGHLSATGGV